MLATITLIAVLQTQSVLSPFRDGIRLFPPPLVQAPPLQPLPPLVGEQSGRNPGPPPSLPPTPTTSTPMSPGVPLPPPPLIISPFQEQTAQTYIHMKSEADRLAANMVLAGMGEAPAGTVPHHIAAHSDPRARASITLLAGLGIHYNNAANGVYLPHAAADPSIGMYHRTIHTNIYHLEVFRRLGAATNESTAKAILDDIRNEIVNGTFPIR